MEIELTDTKDYYPSLSIRIDEQVVGKSAAEVSQLLREGKPRIIVGDMYVHQGIVRIDSLNMNEEIAMIASERLYSVLTS